MNPSDERLLQTLLETRTIAMVGASVRETRDSFRVGQYLVAAGYTVIPVNPTYAGAPLFGTTVRETLAEIDTPVEMLNVFRRSEFVPDTVDAALTALSGLKSVWMQLGVTRPVARTKAEGHGLTVIEDRCVKIEHARLLA